MTKPNLLFIFSDQHRWCDLGCNGNDAVVTPAFDRFAESAVCFNQCISNSPLCVPARGSLLTGLYPLRHGAVANDLPVKTDCRSWAHSLDEAGYATGYIGKWHLGGVPRDKFISTHSERLGFQEWFAANCTHDYWHSYYDTVDNERFPIGGYEPTKQTSLAIDFIKRHFQEPWGLCLSWGPPHSPYQTAPDHFKSSYDPDSIVLRENVPTSIKHTNDVSYGRADIRSQYQGYYGHISALDAEFARLLTVLEELGLRENTLVVYTSDHGDMLGSQGMTNKQLPYEESIRVPLMVSFPPEIEARKTDELICLLDLPNTLLSLLGVKQLPDIDGLDLSAVCRGATAVGRESAYIFDLVPCHQAADRGSDAWRGVRNRRYTYAKTDQDTGFCLYDNQEDPFQMNNLIDSEAHADLRNELLKQTNLLSQRYDFSGPWESLVESAGLIDAWNTSQRHFGLPELDVPSDKRYSVATLF